MLIKEDWTAAKYLWFAVSIREEDNEEAAKHLLFTLLTARGEDDEEAAKYLLFASSTIREDREVVKRLLLALLMMTGDNIEHLLLA